MDLVRAGHTRAQVRTALQAIGAGGFSQETFTRARALLQPEALAQIRQIQALRRREPERGRALPFQAQLQPVPGRISGYLNVTVPDALGNPVLERRGFNLLMQDTNSDTELQTLINDILDKIREAGSEIELVSVDIEQTDLARR